MTVSRGLSQDRQEHVPKHSHRAPAEVHDPPHDVRVVHPIRVGTQGPEAEPECLDLLPVAVTGRDQCLVASFPETEGDGDVWVQVAR